MDFAGLSALLFSLVAGGIVLATQRTAQKRRRKRIISQYNADESYLRYFLVDLDDREIWSYSELPNKKCRSERLFKHHPKFILAAKRHYGTKGLDQAIATHIDFKILKRMSQQMPTEIAHHYYHSEACGLALVEYQEQIDRQNELSTTQALKIVDTHKLLKDKSRKLWESMPETAREEFHLAHGVTARREILSSEISDDLDAESIYPIIMHLYFKDFNMYSESPITP